MCVCVCMPNMTPQVEGPVHVRLLSTLMFFSSNRRALRGKTIKIKVLTKGTKKIYYVTKMINQVVDEMLITR